jgi:hypothetical protein
MRPILQAVNDVPLRVSLQCCETLRVRGSGQLRCESGEVWLTESGSTGDNILVAGEDWLLRPGVEIVLSTLAGARLSVCSRPGATA